MQSGQNLYVALTCLPVPSNQTRNVVLHDNLPPLVSDLLTVPDNPSSPVFDLFGIEHLNLHLDRVTNLDRLKKTPLFDAHAGHTGPMDNTGLYRQSLRHGKG